MRFPQIFDKKFIPAGIVFFGYVGVSFVLRIALMIKVGLAGHIQFWQYPAALLTGLLYDIIVGFFAALPFVFYVWLQNEFIYRKKIIPFVIAGFAIVISALLFTNIVPKEFNALVFKLFIGYIIMRFAVYLLMAFLSLRTRQKMRLFIMGFMLALTFSIIFFNAISEWFFWDEFSTRYNFIAVDYLIYTNEVIGNRYYFIRHCALFSNTSVYAEASLVGLDKKLRGYCFENCESPAVADHSCCSLFYCS